MSYHFSRALAAEYLAVNYWAGAQFVPLRLKTTPEGCLCNGKMMGYWSRFRFGTILTHLMVNHGKELLTWYQAGFPVKTSHVPGKEKESQGSDPASGGRWRELSVKYDPGMSSWKTHRCLFQEVLQPCSVILPRWGMIHNGVLYRHRTAVRPIEGIVSGLWPTPVARDDGKTPDAHMKMKANMPGGARKTITSLAVMVKAIQQGKYRESWPTPRAFMHKGSTVDRGKGNLGEKVGGPLNPTWVEWLMDWPGEWTDLRPSGMDKFQLWLQRHGIS